MKRSKRIYLLLGVLSVVCIATLCVLRFEERTEQIKNSGEIILSCPAIPCRPVLGIPVPDPRFPPAGRRLALR